MLKHEERNNLQFKFHLIKWIFIQAITNFDNKKEQESIELVKQILLSFHIK